MSLPSELKNAIKELGQRFDPEVAKVTRAITVPMHDSSVIADLPVERDIVYGKDERNKLDIYGAGSAQALKPVVIFVHGGGFVMGDKSAQDGAPFYENVGAWAISNDLACVAMTYRLAPAHQYPAGAEDVASAIAWIHANGAEHGLDASRIVLMGQSAGAVHVATYLAKPELQLVEGGGLIAGVLLSGLYDMATAKNNPPKFAYFGEDEKVYAERSSLQGILSDCHIPLLVGVCEYDTEDFQQQALLLLNAIFSRDKRLPAVVYQDGHNHLSSIFLLGSSVDTLGGPLADFVADVLNNLNKD